MKKIIKKTAAAAVSAAALVIMNFSATFGFITNGADAVWPTDSKYKKITTYFSELRNGEEPDCYNYHNAIDIEADGGANIYAVYPGQVVSADWMDGYGYIVILYHPDLNVYTFYAHCSQLNVYAGQNVAQGDVIAAVGSTGQSTGNHLHYGICDTLIGGWPDKLYYDPLTYFTYTDSPTVSQTVPTEQSEVCNCSADYAGVYLTKGVTSYLNIRSGHGSNYPAIGRIYPNDEVIVNMADGVWAHVSVNGVSGYCSMEYLQKRTEFQPGMMVTGVIAPGGELTQGKPFPLKGVISSIYPISRVYGGVYEINDLPTEQYCVVEPDSYTYDISGYFDDHIAFGKLPEGRYYYKVSADDQEGNMFELIRSDFTVAGVPLDVIKGDINGDGRMGISDAVILERYLLAGRSLTSEQTMASDIDGDSIIDGFDLILLKRMLIRGF